MISKSEKAKVLIVEDDKNIREALRYNLIAENYSVSYEKDGMNALDNILENHYDIILLDIMLPNLDGIEICKRVRFEKINTPIIMLTAKDTDIDKILALELGADDYVSKPFSMPELLARIKAVIRRNKIVSDTSKSISKKQFTHLDVYFDLDKRLISVEGQEKFFRPKEFDLAYLLMSNPGVVFTREKLVQKIWGFEYFGDTRTVDVHIRWIREKIENNNSKYKKILTVRGVGYKANVE